MTDEASRPGRALFRWSAFTVAWAVLLLFAGANVTSTRSGDAIPSWPQPWLPRDFSTPALIEWSHRGVAAWMGVFTLVLAIWTQRTDDRPRVKKFAWGVVGLVVVQAVIGGLRVRFVADGVDLTPTWLKVTHAITGQGYFCALVALATWLSPSWRAVRERRLETAGMSVMRSSILGLLLLALQLVLGALGRHGAIPREVHALFALPVMIVLARLVMAGCFDVEADVTSIRRPAALVGVLAACQLALGIVTYFVAATGAAPEAREAAQVVIVNLHLTVGAAILATTLSILLRAVRVWGLPTDERVAQAEAAPGSAS